MTKQDERTTPMELIAAIEWYLTWLLGMDKRFKFTMDAFASSSNKRTKIYCSADQKDWSDRDCRGLAFEAAWSGNVWVNPPYSRGNIKLAAARAVDQLKKSKKLDNVVFLVNQDSTPDWHQDLVDNSFLNVRLKKPRVKFLLDGKEDAGARSSSEFFVMNCALGESRLLRTQMDWRWWLEHGESVLKKSVTAKAER